MPSYHFHWPWYILKYINSPKQNISKEFLINFGHLTDFYVGIWGQKLENFLKTPQAADKAFETELGQKIFPAFQPEKYRCTTGKRQIIHF